MPDINPSSVERVELDPSIERELEQAIRGEAGGDVDASIHVGDVGPQTSGGAGGGSPLPNTPGELGRFARARGLRVNAPARPELKPGESVTTEPERWCNNCEEPRGGRRCHVCKGLTVANIAIEEAPEYEPAPFIRREPPQRQQRYVEEPRFEEEFEEMPEQRASVGSAQGRFGRVMSQPRPDPAPAPARHRGAPPMQQRTQQRRQPRHLQPVGDAYEEQETPTRRNRHARQRASRTAEQELTELWLSGTVNLPLWYQGYAALLEGCQTAEEVEFAAELADFAYIEMMARQRGG